MIKINPKTCMQPKPYRLKTTKNAVYNRNLDLMTVSGAGFGVQLCRIPSWEIFDVSIAAILGAFTIKGMVELIKSRKELQPIIARAKSIKQISKLR